MTEKNVVARPYAKAVFESAVTHNTFPLWSQLLSVAAQVVSDPRVSRLLFDPRRTPAELACFVIDVCSKVSQVTQAASNLIELLATHRRLSALPEISALFEVYYAEQEKRLEVDVISAFKLSVETKEALLRALKKQLNREITLSCDVDPVLLGGAIVRAGDRVIDGSLRGRWSRLAAELGVVDLV